MKLLVSNVGSTSLKFKLFDMPEERVLCEAKIERVGSRDAAIMSYRSHLSGARFSAEGLCIPSYAEGIALFLEKLTGDETGVIAHLADAVFFVPFVGDGVQRPLKGDLPVKRRLEHAYHGHIR